MIPSLAIELQRHHDAWGSIHIFEYDHIRYLTFGDGGEQSAIDLRQPQVPLFEYNQAMLLSLLYQPNPRQITLLGLGGGSLASTLLHLLPNCQLTAVELRADVAMAARRWFALPDSPFLDIAIEDAAHYVATTDTPCDLLFADIYLDEGMQKAQLDDDLLANCARLLRDDGLLVLNLWDEGHGYHPLALERLQQCFRPPFLGCPIEGGNLILLASKQGLPAPDTRHNLAALRRLNRKIGAEIPLQLLFNRLRTMGNWEG